MNQRNTGSTYEKIAAHLLKEKGYHILEMNYHCKVGEVDIIAKEGEYLVFVEVKYRKDTSKGYPSEAVNWKKQKKISQTAAFYLMSHHYSETTCVRFDVVAILGNQAKIIKNAFPYCFG